MKRIRILFAGLLLLALPADARGAYELDVEGFGWRQERRMERLLRDILRDTGDEGLTSFSQAKAEDAVLLLGSELSRRGFLEPTITFVLEGEGEELARVRMDPNADLRDLPWGRGDRVVFRVERGERAFFETIRIDGLTVMAEDAAKEFFAAPAGLLTTEGERAYSPASLDNGMASLRRRLAQLGRPEATVSLAEPPQIAPSGEVSVHLTVDEGPPFVWGAGRLEGVAEVVAAETEPLPAAPAPGTVFNEESVDDWALAVRNRHYAAGYPDVRIGRERRPEPALDSPEVRMVVALSVEPGPRVRLGEVEVRGLEKTQPGLVRRVAGLETGDWLNPLELEQARFALGRLGVFEDIAVSTVAKPEAAAEGPVRDLVLRLEERSRRDFSLLFGYGSFEQLRVGLEARAYNLFGRAHSAQVRLRQSFRSSAVRMLYNVPRPLPGIEAGQARLQGLLRDEIAFERQEALFAVGVRRSFFDGAVEASAEYRFELLRSVDAASEELIGETRANVGSLLFGAGWDTRDRLIAPTEGASAYAQVELASPVIGAEASFQRFIVRSSLHRSFDHRRLRWHFGFEGGVLGRLGSEAFELPVNKRFFPGGENSIRGYREGEAGPLDSAGEPIGAELYALGHVEFETRLIGSFNVVLFVDGVWSAADLESMGNGEALFSAGAGIRYATPLGPLRLEYGHNLNPRPADPGGTVHFSIGFPF